MVGDLLACSREDKVRGRRRYRRMLENSTRAIAADPERFYNEPFNVKRYTGWDIA